MARTLTLVKTDSTDELDELQLRPEDLPDDADLSRLTRVVDAHGEEFWCTSETVEALLWIGRPHTAEDP